METNITWLIRYGHVLSAATWLGGYALLVLAIAPALKRDAPEAMARLLGSVVRLLNAAGIATMVFGLLLIWRTRGYGQVGQGEWGGIIVMSMALAIALMGIGDGALRPALRRISETGSAPTLQRWSLVGLALAVLAIGLMTRALYATS